MNIDTLNISPHCLSVGYCFMADGASALI